jgi:hypothetical protein
MKVHTIGLAFALSLALAATAARAEVTAPAHPSLALSVLGVGTTAAPQLAYRGYGRYHGRYYPSIRYQPRHTYAPPPQVDQNGNITQPQNPVRGYLELHGGAFAPTELSDNGWWLFGGKFGADISGKVQLGVLSDWSHRTVHETTLTGTSDLPGGQPVERRIDLSEASSDLVPVLGFVQVSPFGTAFSPYFGVAGGYEAFMVKATDFATGADFDATYDGFGWQYYAGIAIPLTKAAKFDVEAFGNAGNLDREIDDPTFGRVREIVNASGGGIRGGLSWAF